MRYALTTFSDRRGDFDRFLQHEFVALNLLVSKEDEEFRKRKACLWDAARFEEALERICK
jgi:hypothetical protein